jgi:hypothetical protein
MRRGKALSSKDSSLVGVKEKIDISATVRSRMDFDVTVSPCEIVLVSAEICRVSR